jgi:hypothetical protein
MKKIKITERQAELLGLNKNTKNTLKITQEQYDRIFGSKMLKEDKDKSVDNDPLYVEYYKEMSGEEPFEMNGNKYQYVWAKYPDGKVDVGTYAFGQDLVYAYDKFKTMHKLQEDSDIKGGEARVDNAFKKEMPVSNDVVNLKPVDEEAEGKNFNIRQKTSDVPSSIQDFGKPISEEEEEGNIKTEMKGLISRLYGKSNELSPYWEKKGLTFDKICLELLKNNPPLIKSSGDNTYVITKAMGDKDQTLQAIEDKLTSISEGIDTTVDLQEGDWFDSHPEHPSNQPNQQYTKRSSVPTTDFETIAFNKEIAIMKHKNDLWCFNYFYLTSEDEKGFGRVASELGKVPMDSDGQDEEGFADYTYGEFDIDGEILSTYVDENLNTLSKGIGMQGWESDANLVKIDDVLKAELLDIYDKDRNITNALSPMQEGDDRFAKHAADREKIKTDLGKGFTGEPSVKSSDEKSAILQKIKDIRAKELARRKESGEIDETTAASSGAFTGPLFGKMKEEEGMVRRELKETTSGSDSTGEYTVPAFKMKKNHTDFAEVTTKAETTPQWAGGAFVEQPECSKPNNNKEAQNGGCNSGASSLKVKYKKGSINAPSLGEDKIYETIAKKTGKTVKEVITIIKSKNNKA